jgi:hypothetical protein
MHLENKNIYEFRLESARGGGFLLAVFFGSTSLVASRGRSGSSSSSRRSSLDEGTGNNFSGQVEFLSQEFDTFVVQGVIKVHPREAEVNEATRVQRLHQLDNLEVGHVDIGVADIEVLLGDENAFLEQELVDLLSVFLGNQHYFNFQVKMRLGVDTRRTFEILR